MLTVSNVTKRYGPKLALDRVSFDVPPGQIVGLLGTNGAGKTTTMNIITGYISATSGDVSVDGHDILTEPLEAKRCIGYLPEQPPLYPDLTVEESLDFYVKLRKVRGDRAAHVDAICERVRIDSVRRRLTKNLSKGFRQRVGLALALIGDPPLLILDEPMVGLDPVEIVEIRNLIRDLAGTRTVILSSHNLQEVQAVCSRILVIHEGRLIADDSAENLIRRSEMPQHAIRVRLEGDAAANARLISELPGVRGVMVVDAEQGTSTLAIETDDPGALNGLFYMELGDRRVPLKELYTAPPSLEEAFVALTGQDRSAGESWPSEQGSEVESC